jgi:hypothetical protein
MSLFPEEDVLTKEIETWLVNSSSSTNSAVCFQRFSARPEVSGAGADSIPSLV